MNTAPPPMPIERWEVLDLLTSLVQKSLVAYEEDEQGCGRYRLLETVRQYARDRLFESGDAAAMHGRHRDWFLVLAEQAQPELVGGQQAEWFDRLEREDDNLRAALDWSQTGDQNVEKALRLAGALWWFWAVHNHGTEGLTRVEELLAWTEGDEPTVARAQALLGAANLAWSGSRYQEAQALFELFGEKPGVARCLNDRGLIAEHQGDLAAARALQEQALALHREFGNQQGIAWTIFFLGSLAALEGDAERARFQYEESLIHFEKLGEKHGIAMSLLFLGMMALERGDAVRARSLHEQSVKAHRELGHQVPTAWALLALAETALAQGDDEATRSLLSQGLAIFQHPGNNPSIAEALVYLRHVATVGLDDGRAPAPFEERQAIFRELGSQVGVLSYLEERAAAVATAQPERAARLFGAAQALREAMDDPLRPEQRAERDRSVAAIRTALGEAETGAEARLGREAASPGARFAAAWAEGQAMSLAQAVRYALEQPAHA